MEERASNYEYSASTGSSFFLYSSYGYDGEGQI